MRRSRSAAVVVLALVAAGCSIESAMRVPDCEEGESSLLAAQSVPTAELVPCFDRLPAGWDVDAVDIGHHGTMVRFDSDRAGGGAAVFHFTESCDTGTAVSAPSEQEGADRFDHIDRVDPAFRAQRYYVFPGGCIWWEFDFNQGAPAALSIELGDRLVTVRRDVVNEAVRESFIGEDL